MSLIDSFLTDTNEVERRGPGRWVRGRYEKGQLNILTVKMSVQPLSREQLLQLPEGQRTSDALNFYTDLPLFTGDEKKLRSADIVRHRGKRYQIEEVGDWTKTDLPHYRSIGMKVDGEGRGADN